MTNSRWELPVLVLVSCTGFFTAWHWLAWLLG